MIIIYYYLPFVPEYYIITFEKKKKSEQKKEVPGTASNYAVSLEPLFTGRNEISLGEMSFRPINVVLYLKHLRLQALKLRPQIPY